MSLLLAAGSAGSVTVALNGVTSTTTARTFTATGGTGSSATAALSSVSTTTLVKSVNNSNSVGLSGVSTTVSVSIFTLVASDSTLIETTPITATFAVKSVAPQTQLLVSGVSATGPPGSPTSTIATSLSGVASASSVTTFTASTAAIATLSGVTSTSSVNTFTASTAAIATLSGVTSSSSVTTVAKSATVALSGVNASSTIGTVNSLSSIGLTGVTATTKLSIDPYWANVVLSVNFDASFTDISSYANVATLGGTPTISSTQVKFGPNSGFFNGTSYVKYPLNTNFNVGSNDFTIEAWVYPTVTPHGVYLFVGQSDYTTVPGSSFQLNLGQFGVDAPSAVYIGSTTYSVAQANPPTLAWSHVALVRNGTNLTTFLNGVMVATIATLGTGVVNTGATTNPPSLGGWATGANAFTGYIDDFRFTNGIARYPGTASFTPPTIANPTTSSNINASLAQSLSSVNSVVYNPSANIGINSSFALNGNTIIESVATIVASGGTNYNASLTGVTSADSVGSFTPSSSSTIALTGVIAATTTMAPSITSTKTLTGVVGSSTSYGDPYWNSVVVASTFDNALVDESSFAQAYTVYTGATLSSAQSKFTSKSALFDGVNGCITIANTPSMNVGSNDFTIEMWLYQIANPNGYAQVFTSESDYFNAANIAYTLRINTTASYVCVGTSFISVTSPAVGIGAWTHIAMVRSGNTLTTYSNGVVQGTATVVGAINVGNTFPPSLGAGKYTGGLTTAPFNGYISDFRFTNGVARYTAPFAIPTTAFPTAPLGGIVIPSEAVVLNSGYTNTSAGALAASSSTSATAALTGVTATTTTNTFNETLAVLTSAIIETTVTGFISTTNVDAISGVTSNLNAGTAIQSDAILTSGNIETSVTGFLAATDTDALNGVKTTSTLSQFIINSVVALSGVLTTANANNLNNSPTTSLSGVLTTSQVNTGSAFSGGTATLTSATSSSNTGTVVPSSSSAVALTGTTILVNTGNLNDVIASVLGVVSETSTTGFVAAIENINLTGVTSKSSIGVFSDNFVESLSGNTISYTTGSLTSSISETLSAVTSATVVKTATPNAQSSLNGISSFSAIGTFTPITSSTATLTQVTASFSSGTMIATAGAVAALTGTSITSSVGVLAKSDADALGNIIETATLGIIAGSLSVALTGTNSTTSVGVVTQSDAEALGNIIETNIVGTLKTISSVALSGTTITTSVGQLPITASLTGVISNTTTGQFTKSDAEVLGVVSEISSVGSLGVISSSTVALRGVAISTSISSFPDTQPLSGVVAISTTNTFVTDRKFTAALTGINATISIGKYSLVNVYNISNVIFAKTRQTQVNTHPRTQLILTKNRQKQTNTKARITTISTKQRRYIVYIRKR